MAAETQPGLDVVDCPECHNPVPGEECDLCGWRRKGATARSAPPTSDIATTQNLGVQPPPSGAPSGGQAPPMPDAAPSPQPPPGMVAVVTPNRNQPPPKVALPVRPSPKRGFLKPLVVLFIIGVVIFVVVTIVNSAKSSLSGGISGSGSYPDVHVSAGKECSRIGSGPFAAVGVGNKTTTCGFASNVRVAYVSKFPSGGAGTVSAHSPTTSKTYSMSCSGSQPVRCTGGVAAVVLIYGGKLRVG
jgi:hypothetical protein